MKIKLLIALALITTSAHAVELDQNFLKAINAVEASGRHGNIVGDHGKALGGYQIHKEFWIDATQYDKTIGGKYSDVTNKAYAEKVVTAYLNRYAKKAIIAQDYKTLAATFHRGKDNETYWKKVKKNLDSKKKLEVKVLDK